jgi:FAD/FMN-containing dehydrogenase
MEQIMRLPLPAGISQQEFDKAMGEFREIVGSEWTFTSEEDVLLYRDAYSPLWGEPEELLPSAAVAPSTSEEVQALLRIANSYRIPMYPISTGKNLGYGGSAPTYSGSVVLDLKRMNRILEVNEKQAHCLVEPGVSYFDIYNHLQENNIRLWIDLPDPGWGSMVGNALDRGAGYTAAQFRNHFDAHCGMEVVLANGDVLRTGMGAVPNSKTWQSYKSGFGPWIDGMFSQSNFGVVTKMGFWLMPEPEAHLKGAVHFRRYKDLIPLIDIMTHLENSKVFTGYPDLLSPLLRAPGLVGVHDFMVNGPDTHEDEYMALLQRGATAEEYEPYALKHDIPFWSCIFSFYGPEKIIRAQWEHVQDRYKAEVQGVSFEETEFYKTPLSEQQKTALEHPPQLGVPSLKTFVIGARTPWNPKPSSRGHTWFSPLIPRDGKEVFRVNEVLGKAARDLDVPFGFAFNVPFPAWERCLMFIIFFPISEDPEINKKNRESFRKLVRIAADHGWSEYRTASVFQGDVMATYSFNNNALLRFHETVKDAVDPNGILSPGRYGIWPKHLRSNKK